MLTWLTPQTKKSRQKQEKDYEKGVHILSDYMSSANCDKIRHSNEGIDTILKKLETVNTPKTQSQKQKNMLSSYMLSAYGLHKTEERPAKQNLSILDDDNTTTKVRILFGID